MDREVDYERKTEFFFIINLFILDKILRISLNVDALDLRIWNRNFLSTYSPWNSNQIVRFIFLIYISRIFNMQFELYIFLKSLNLLKIRYKINLHVSRSK